MHEEKSILINNNLLLKLFEESQKIFFILNYNINKYKTSFFISNNKYDLNYDEILLVGSGKGVASVKMIKQINWKRKNLV